MSSLKGPARHLLVALLRLPKMLPDTVFPCKQARKGRMDNEFAIDMASWWLPCSYLFQRPNGRLRGL